MVVAERVGGLPSKPLIELASVEVLGSLLMACAAWIALCLSELAAMGPAFNVHHQGLLLALTGAVLAATLFGAEVAGDRLRGWLRDGLSTLHAFGALVLATQVAASYLQVPSPLVTFGVGLLCGLPGALRARHLSPLLAVLGMALVGLGECFFAHWKQSMWSINLAERALVEGVAAVAVLVVGGLAHHLRAPRGTAVLRLLSLLLGIDALRGAAARWRVGCCFWPEETGDANLSLRLPVVQALVVALVVGVMLAAAVWLKPALRAADVVAGASVVGLLAGLAFHDDLSPLMRQEIGLSLEVLFCGAAATAAASRGSRAGVALLALFEGSHFLWLAHTAGQPFCGPQWPSPVYVVLGVLVLVAWWRLGTKARRCGLEVRGAMP